MRREKKTIEEIRESTRQMILERWEVNPNIDAIAGIVRFWEGVTDENAKQLTQTVIARSMRRENR